MNRPKFEDIKTYDEFIKYYWYREELQEICKKLNLEYLGGKIELNNVIKSYFDGVIIAHKPKTVLKSKTDNLTSETSLLDCGFTFSQKFRDYFIKETGDKNFKFTADMVATVKAVKENKDKTFTLKDLLDIKLGKNVYVKYDKSSCQWNKFLKDFCADECNNVYSDKLKTASKFWKLLRVSDLPKVYSREFIKSNKDNI